MGAERRAHHRQQEAMRAATAEANMIAEIQRQGEERMRQQAEALRKQMEQEYQAPVTSTLGDTNVGVRTARSARATTAGLAKGVAALRIPLNLGGASGGGLNI